MKAGAEEYIAPLEEALWLYATIMSAATLADLSSDHLLTVTL
jgi:hypothetical protein